jgi:two-component system, sensor histidine kinase and response regulator
MTTQTPQPTILVVEDELNILRIVSYLLEEQGYKVLQASEGLTALALVERQLPDLIISDIKMPGMDGFTLCERVRANPSLVQTPFIFLTAREQRSDMRRGMGLGADDYLTKPFEPEELLSAVSVRLARAAQTRAAIGQADADLQDKIIRALTHEFRTPLSLVIGYTELLESSGPELDEADFTKVLQGLHTGSRRLMDLVEDFLLLSKIRAGVIARETPSDRIPCPTPDLVVRMVVEQFQKPAASRNVSLEVDCKSGNPTLNIRENHLFEIASRLVDNAIKFSKRDGGQVQVTTSSQGDMWLLSVSDEGIGIRREALSWIFEAFRQVDRGKLEQQGSGIGLTIVRGLVEAYGGAVHVHSTPGQGSTFYASLPMATA